MNPLFLIFRRFFISLVFTATAGFAAEPLQLVASIDGQRYPLDSVRDGKLFIHRDGAPVEPGAQVLWELAGDPAELNRSALWSPTYGIRRSSPPDITLPLKNPWQGLVSFHHRVGKTPDGSPQVSELLNSWPDAFRADGVLIAVWLFAGQPVAVQPKPYSSRAQRSWKLGISLPLDESTRRGQPVLLLWQNGKIVPPLPRFDQSAEQAAFLAVLQDDFPALDALLLADPKLARTRIKTDKSTLLHFAAEAGSTRALRRLLAAGLDADIENRKSVTALSWAAANGRDDAVSLLLTAGASPLSTDYNKRTPVYAAATHGHATTVRLLLDSTERRANRTAKNYQSPLTIALNNGHADIARLLLADGAEYDFLDDQSARVLATQVALGHTGVVRLFIENKTRVDVPAGGYTALFAAANRDDPALLDILLAAGAPVDQAPEDGVTPLMAAAARGNIAHVERLLAAGAKVSAVSRNGDTPLHYAALKGEPAVLQKLLAAGADVNAANRSGYTPLSIALSLANPDGLPALEAARPALPKNSDEGARLLFLAIASDRDALVAAALAQGWSTDATLSGWSLLDLARLYRAKRTSALLVSAGAKSEPADPGLFVGAKELDALPKPLAVASPGDPRGVYEDFPESKVVVDFIVGTDGNVLFPRIVKSADPRLSFAVLETARTWRFTPPLKAGRAAVTRVSLPVVFPNSSERLFETAQIDSPPQPLTRVKPDFPRNAPPGFITLVFEVSPEGRAENITVSSSSHPEFANNAIDAVKLWEFSPGLKNGEPVRTRVFQEFHFDRL
jgi:uncharacterized protein